MAEHLLALAAQWRQYAEQTTDPYFIKVMHRTAMELESRARRILEQGPNPSLETD